MKSRIEVSAVVCVMILILGGVGCTTTSTKPCESNDFCVEKASCSASTGGCAFWDSQLTILDYQWKDAVVGNSYSVEFEASGGFPPYTWNLNDGQTDTYPAWLTLTPEGDNNLKATLQNKSGQLLLPADLNSSGIPIKITVVDYTKRGNADRLDNKGVSINETLKINGCSDRYVGDTCDQCAPRFTGYPNCDQCTTRYTGYPNCDQCATGYAGYPDCQCIELTGTWITRLTTTGTISAPSPVGTLTGATVDVVQRMYINHVSNEYVTQLEICSLNTIANGSLPFSIDYLPAVLSTLGGTGATLYVCPLSGTLAVPSFAINSGWGGVVPTTNTCPAPSGGGFPVTTCSGAIDSDGDGIYGITLPTHLIGGTLNYMAYSGLTMNVSFNDMVLTNETTINGNSNFSMNGYQFGSTAGWTGTFNVIPDSTAVPVTAIKLEGNVPCTTVLTHCTGATCVP